MKEKRMLVWDEMCENNDLEYFFCNPKQIVPLQWTGMVDSNSNYIYQGDILQISHDRYEYRTTNHEDEIFDEVAVAKQWNIVIEYEQQYSRWNVDGLTCDLEKRYDPKANYKAVVIGNIYQNPDLISPAPTIPGR